MKKFILMLVRHWSGSPMKIMLTLSALALGTGILILSSSAGMILKELTDRQLNEQGVILYAANGTWDAAGEVDQNRPPEWDSDAPASVVSGVEEVLAAVPVTAPPFHQITVNGQSWNLRKAVGTGPDYFDIFSLDLAAGSPMTDEDIEMGRKRVWISEEMAQLLFGSAEEAVDNWIQPPGEMLSRGPGRNRQQNVVIQYIVAGVFETPTEVARRSYGIGDLIFPYTSLIPSGMNSRVAMDMMAGQFVVRSDGSSAEKTSASIRQALTASYGDDIDILVWEGSPEGESSYMEELRRSIRIFSVSLSLLGLVLLLTSSLGIFSIMVVEALNRRRDIALERSLGASRAAVVKEFGIWSITLSLTGAAAGVILSLLLARPVLSTLSPLVGEVSASFSEAAGLRGIAVLQGIALAVLCGGILGMLPSFSAVRGNIAETLREA